MMPFDFQPLTRLVFGPGRIDELGELAAGLAGSRAMIVSDPGIVKAGHHRRGLESLHAAGFETFLFDGVEENPSTDNVEMGLAAARDFEPNVLIGLGGGSSMDCAKGINFLYTNGGQISDYWGVGKARRHMLPMIAIPTTSGTGSEAQSFALISDSKTHVKMACGDKKAACRIALLDPQLTVTQPPRVTSLTGIDAVAHALETYVTRPRNPVSLMCSREAWRLLEPNFPRVLADPLDLEARGAMQLGAFFAGMAIENSMLGAAHALANPLTQHYNVVHGQAVAAMLPHVIRFNGKEVGRLYGELLPNQNGAVRSPDLASGELADRVSRLVVAAGLSLQLRELGVATDRLPQLAADAARQWTGGFNPRTVGEAELHELYLAAY